MAEQKSKKQKQPLYVSPIGIASFPWLNSPDTKFDPAGEYTVKLLVTESEAKELIAKFQPVLAEGVKQAIEKNGKTKNFKTEMAIRQVEDDDGNLTEQWSISFKQKAKVLNKKTNETFEIKPTLVDAKKNELPDNVRIFSGSKLRIVFTAYVASNPATKTHYLLFRPSVVQVIELAKGAGNKAGLDALGDIDGLDISAEAGDVGALPDGSNSNEGDSQNVSNEGGDEF